MALAVANRYAQALADVVTKPGSAVSPEAALEQLSDFHGVLEESHPLQGVLTSPAVAPANKRALVAKLCDRLDISRSVRNFLYVVIDHRRVQLLNEMIEAFRSWLDDRAGIARLRVTSAQAIDNQQRDAFLEKFGRVIGKRVIAEFRVSPRLVGGATVRHRSTVFDGSLRAQLQALDRAIAGES